MDSYNHGDALLAYFQNLQQQQRFTDVTIQCDGEFIANCHRIILAAYSSHFEAALAGVEGSSTITLDIDPKITGVNAGDLKSIVDFMYNGRVQVSETLRESAAALGCGSLQQLLVADDIEPDSMIEDAGHTTRLLEAVRTFYMEQKFVDVTINCQGVPLASCHRLILCAYSEHFESALASTENCPLVTLDIDSAITGVTSQDLRTIIEFMYSGNIRIAKRRVKSLTAAARALGVTKLTEILSVGEGQRLSSGGAGYGSSSLLAGSSRQSGGAAAKVERLPAQDHGAYAGGVGEDPNFDVHAIGATEDVGAAVEDAVNDVIRPMMTGYVPEEPTPRELTAADDYVDIYEEYVSGPSRGRRGGTYGLKTTSHNKKSFQIKPAQRMTSSDSLIYGVPTDEDNNNGGAEAAGGSQEGTPASGEDSANAVTMTFTPAGKRRRVTDSFGYGLPEIVAQNDVTVPLLVGDQAMMMEKPFKCPYCDHRTKEKSAVEKHIRCIHTLEAPYKCRYCNQAFKVQSNLVRHIRAHTGEKPYVCKKCGAAYADKKNMDAHVFREHLKMKPLECPAPGCTAKFWRQDRFNYHCRRVHEMLPPESPEPGPEEQEGPVGVL